MKSGIGGQLVLLGIGLAMAGCVEPAGGDGYKIGRYLIATSGEGFSVHESSSWMSRLLETLFGQKRSAKIRVGEFRGEPNDYRPDQIASTLVRKRKLKGPAAKPTAMRRPWEVRLLGPDGSELRPFFYFRRKAEAESFSARLQSLLDELRNR